MKEAICMHLGFISDIHTEEIFTFLSHFVTFCTFINHFLPILSHFYYQGNTLQLSRKVRKRLLNLTLLPNT